MQRLIDLLITLYEYDVAWLTTPWVIYTVVPALLYTAFMAVKWAVLTMPLWLPLSLAFKPQITIKR
jgi:hypothetical protein